MNKLIEINNLNFGYNEKSILHNIDFDVFENDFIGIIGPNGGGKSTLLKLILQQLTPKSGTIKYFTDNKETTKLKIGYLPQINHFDSKFPINIKDVVLSGLLTKKTIFRKLSVSEKAHADAIMGKFNLMNIREKAVGELSGGQIQKALLARAIISNPQVLLLDEPSTFVDANFEKELYSILEELNKEMAVIIVSHDVGMISSFVKTIACVNGELHYHPSNEINTELLKSYKCPIDLITHGKVPHRVLKNHK